jgi:hypothetical protein
MWVLEVDLHVVPRLSTNGACLHFPYAFRAIYFTKHRGYFNLFLVPVLRMLLRFADLCCFLQLTVGLLRYHLS